MAVSGFQKVLNKLFKEFALRMGREPQTPKEWMDLQNEAVRYFNLTKGKGVTGSVRTSGGDVRPIADPTIGFKPKVIQGGKKPGIEGIALERFPKETHEFFGRPLKEKDFSKIDELIESGVIKRGEAPKTKLSVVEGKKQKLDTAISKEEWIAKKHRENKEAVERFKKKHGKKTVEDFRDEGDWDPGGMADGGRANFIFGGSAGLRALIKRMRGSNKRIMPSGIPTDKRDLVKTLMPREVEQFENLKVAQLENLLEGLKLDKEQMAMRAQKKAMSDPGLDFLMGKLDEMPGSGLTPEGDLAKYADIDKDILTLEQMIKNKRMKGRKPHESGGLAYMLGEPTYMKYGVGGSVGHAPWHKPTGRPQPQGQDQSPTPQLGGAQSPGRGQPNPMKAPRLPSVAPRTMDPQYMQQQMMQKMMMGQGQQGQQRPRMAEGGFTQDDFNQFLKEREEGYREGGKHQLEEDWERYKRFKQYGPVAIQEVADGGRIGMAAGSIVKGGKWMIKNLRKAYDELIEGKAFTHLPEWEREGLKWEILAQMKQIERGGPIPKEMIEYMSKDKRFKDITKTRSTDPELYEVEDVLLNYGKKGDVVDEQVEVLEKFTPTGKGNAEGGRIGLMYGGDPGFQFEYGGSWADWRDSHQHQMPVTDYIKTKLPKERLPFRDMKSGGIARLPFAAGGFSKARRAFLKLLAKITGAGIVGGTGLLKLGSKAAPKVIKEAEVITRGADGMPKYVFDLIEVVKAKGTRDIIEGFKKSDYSTVHTYKGVDVIEDGAGNIKIKSDKSGVATDPYTGKMHEGISQENHIQIEKGETIIKDEGLETQKAIQAPDEYIEGTVYPDMDGKMKDFEEGLDEAIHLDFKNIADEIDTLIIKRPKKASGGLAHMLGE